MVLIRFFQESKLVGNVLPLFHQRSHNVNTTFLRRSLNVGVVVRKTGLFGYSSVTQNDGSWQTFVSCTFLKKRLFLTAELHGTWGLPNEMLGMDGELKSERSDKLPCWLLLVKVLPYGTFSLSYKRNIAFRYRKLHRTWLWLVAWPFTKNYDCFSNSKSSGHYLLNRRVAPSRWTRLRIVNRGRGVWAGFGVAAGIWKMALISDG